MIKARLKKWSMKPQTRSIVSEAIRFCKEINETYNQRVSIRQIYYHLFSKGIISLNDSEYKKVVRTLTTARKRGYLAFDSIEDRSRKSLWQMLYGNLPQFLTNIKNNYIKDTWRNQDNFIIILIEKESLAPIIADIANKYNVFVFPTKGFSSWSMFLGDIRTLREHFGPNKNLIVLVMSDLDPSGGYIHEDYKSKFRFMVEELEFKAPTKIERIAITKAQVEKYKLPAMKKKYRDRGTLEIWELDALDPRDLRNTVKNDIEKYLDLEVFKKDCRVEKNEKEFLQFLIESGIEELTKSKDTKTQHRSDKSDF